MKWLVWPVCLALVFGCGQSDKPRQERHKWSSEASEGESPRVSTGAGGQGSGPTGTGGEGVSEPNQAGNQSGE
jgi:hypothetical protein